VNVPPPGPLLDEATKFADALLGRVRTAATNDLPPELRERFAAAVADAAVAGAGLLRVVAEVAAAWGSTAGPSAEADSDTPPTVEHIDIN
jgi:hypothetical protein